MKKLEFKIAIEAPAAIVWKALWEDQNYKKWTAVFCEGSYTKTDWKEGSRVHFLSPSGEGMYSTIEKMVPNEKMYFTHIGEMKNFEEQPLTDETRKWSGARENYTLSENNGTTTLLVEMDITEDYQDYFNEAFPKGLALVKEMAEQSNG
ncbi:SRPBCC domain-containing protein [Flavobacterium humi]|uniref:SRPBCC domain-containing protein n=1 Tax=Flavobacterium humi TaxID=2562683 RepID=A0A4Z0LA38_9FLAO|nr:SRPBCC domain-containing protein [Flavobacterium humi]TGD57918.1 SRPBCC domain-containing protein [Flavobacterium humi]